MRSKWPAELILIWVATATMEAAWIALVNMSLQWLKHTGRLDLTVVHFFLAVGVGMALARAFRHLSQNRYAAILTAGALGAAVTGAIMSGAPTNDAGAFFRAAVLDPGVWLMGFAVLRGVFQAEPGAGYETERVFSLGIPAMVFFWLLSTASGLVEDKTFALQAFASSLSFVAAGLLALGLGRLKDLDVDAVDRGARRRWLSLVVGIVALVLVIGVPLAAVLGLPVTAVVIGVLGPIAPILFYVFYLLSIPIFWFLNLLVGVINPREVPLPSINVPSPIGNGPPPLFEPPKGAPPDLTWLLIALVLVGAFVLLRVVASFLSKPTVNDRAGLAVETRTSEPITLPALPALPRLRLPARRPTPRTASEAYRLSLAALADGPDGRRADETPREHASRVTGTGVGRDVGRLATDYQLDAFAGVRLTATETRRALDRWRRVVRAAGRRP